MKKTIFEWLKDTDCAILSRVDKNKKITKEEFEELLSFSIIIENKYYSR